MKRKSPFTIVNRPVELRPSREEVEAKLSMKLKREAPELAQQFELLPRAFKDALLSTALEPELTSTSHQTRRTMKAPATRAISGMDKVVQKLASEERAATVGLLDLGAWVSRLPKLLEVMNGAQRRIVFFELQTPVPAGLIKTKEPLVAWVEHHYGRPLTSEERQEVTCNMLADEFFFFAESVRQQYELGMLIGLTPAMIAFLGKNGPEWNYFAGGRGKVSVVSTYDLREFSKEAKRPYEAAVGMLLVAQVFALRDDRLGYHEETRGCIFDFNEIRSSLTEGIRAMRIDDDCLSLFQDPADKNAAVALVGALAKMKENRSG